MAKDTSLSTTSVDIDLSKPSTYHRALVETKADLQKAFELLDTGDVAVSESNYAVIENGKKVFFKAVSFDNGKVTYTLQHKQSGTDNAYFLIKDERKYNKITKADYDKLVEKIKKVNIW